MAKEETLVIDGAWTTGLRPNSRAPRNSQVCSTLQNVRVRPEGLIAYEPVVQPVSDANLAAASVTISFPTPQLFKGRGVTLLADATKLFTVNESTWAITQVTTYDLYSPATPKSITSGGSWHFMDFYGTFLLFNGSCVILKFGGDSKYYVQDTLSVQTGCAHRGRAIQAGFSTSNFWSSTWKTFWTSRILSDNPPNSSIIQTMTDIGPNWLWAGAIGGGDLRFLHDLTWATTGPYTVGHSSAHPLVLDYMNRNAWDLVSMPFQGTIKKVHSLGQHVFVGGTDGIEVITQHAQFGGHFGSTLSLPFGIAGRSAAGGSTERMVFVDEDGCLWHLDASLKLDRLDYTEFFNPMLGTDIVVTYDAHEQDFFICNTTDGYTLSRDGGLSQSPQKITSQAFTQGGPIGFFTTEANTSFLAVTEWFDCGFPGLKQIQTIQVEGNLAGTLQVALDYRFNKDSAATRTSFTTTNSQGIVTKIQAGQEFRLVLQKPSTYTSVKIENVKITWKPVDARYTHS